MPSDTPWFQASVARLRHGTRSGTQFAVSLSHLGCCRNPWQQSTQGSGLNLAWCFKTSGQNATALTFTERGPRNLYTLNLDLFLGPLVDDPTLLILWRVTVGSHIADILRYIATFKSHASLLNSRVQCTVLKLLKTVQRLSVERHLPAN